LSSECSCGRWDERVERTRRTPGSGKDEGLKYAIHVFIQGCEGGTHFTFCPYLQIVGQDIFGIRVEQGKVVRGGEDIGNVHTLITGIIAAGLYGNIGIST